MVEVSSDDKVTSSYSPYERVVGYVWDKMVACGWIAVSTGSEPLLDLSITTHIPVPHAIANYKNLVAYANGDSSILKLLVGLNFEYGSLTITYREGQQD